MRIKSKFGEIRSFCQANADETTVQKYARFFVEGYDAYGLDRRVMEKQRDVWLREYGKDLDFEGFLKLGDLLVQSGKYEEASFAIGFAASFTDEFTPDVFDRLGRWLENGIRNWAHTDVFCSEVLSPFITKGIVPVEAFSQWRNSGSKWKRRAVPVTLIKALTGNIGVSYLFEFISPMMLDSEKVVQQGLGWFLRETWKKHPTLAEMFLLDWKDSCGRLIIRYATEKMDVGKKAQFKRNQTKSR